MGDTPEGGIPTPPAPPLGGRGVAPTVPTWLARFVLRRYLVISALIVVHIVEMFFYLIYQLLF